MAAASTNDQGGFWQQHPNSHIRLLGREQPAGKVLVATQNSETDLFRLPQSVTGRETDDYTQVDPLLPLAREDGSSPDPLPHTSYAGLTPVQRRRFANWLTSPEVTAPAAFRHLYLAWLELGLLEKERRAEATAELGALLDATGWRSERGLGQSCLLAGWLAQDGTLLTRAIARGSPSADQMSAGSGWLARLAYPLDPGCALALARGWELRVGGLADFSLEQDGGLLHLRLTSQASGLGADLLAWALAEAGNGKEAPTLWRPWHTVHRQVRLLLPWIDLRPLLEPKLGELFASLPQAARKVPREEASGEPKAEHLVDPAEWTLILEFGDSRSQHYDYVAHLARKQPGYRLLMDETRQLIHRVRFRKRNLRQFWRLWSYVESWASVRVYVNGEEVQKWNVYPYSAEMR